VLLRVIVDSACAVESALHEYIFMHRDLGIREPVKHDDVVRLEFIKPRMRVFQRSMPLLFASSLDPMETKIREPDRRWRTRSNKLFHPVFVGLAKGNEKYQRLTLICRSLSMRILSHCRVIVISLL